jgi:hypothetical protein
MGLVRIHHPSILTSFVGGFFVSPFFRLFSFGPWAVLRVTLLNSHRLKPVVDGLVE